jgi:hypothetical protein
MNFKKLNFGAPEAERDLAHGLMDYFVRSEAYTRVASRQKYIISGIVEQEKVPCSNSLLNKQKRTTK